MIYTAITTKAFSGYPHPSVMRLFCVCNMAHTRLYDGSREPNTIPSGNKLRRLNAAVEARHPTTVANTRLNVQEAVMAKHSTGELRPHVLFLVDLTDTTPHKLITQTQAIVSALLETDSLSPDECRALVEQIEFNLAVLRLMIDAEGV